MTLWLSRVRIARGADLDALRPLLDPGALHGAAMDPRMLGQQTDAHHRLIWTLFADRHDRRRDFLWRAEGAGRFTLLSARPPGPSRVFDDPEVKPFAPVLAPGDHLAFTMRVNATRTVKTGKELKSGKEHKAHHDIVMMSLRDVPGGTRDDVRSARALSAAQHWMAGQGERAGFSLETDEDGTTRLEVGDYSVAALPGHSGRRKGQPQYGILDLSGLLTVTDPAAFLYRLGQGFGRARGFGCGLMLIRRA